MKNLQALQLLQALSLLDILLRHWFNNWKQRMSPGSISDHQRQSRCCQWDLGLVETTEHSRLTWFHYRIYPWIESVLEQTTQNIKIKKESAYRLKLQINAMHQQCDLITQYWGWINEIKEKGKEYKDRVETYNAYILSWTKQMDELKKIEEVEQKESWDRNFKIYLCWRKNDSGSKYWYSTC